MSKHSRSKVDSGLNDSDDKEFKIGNYLIGQTIGEGTFGLVKTATHILSGESVAVKILEKNRFKEQADTVRVNREIKILKKTRHSNIIQLYEVLDTPSSIYLMMEISSGGEMFDYIVSNRKVAEPLSCNFFHQIIDGVEALHNNFVTHRDLKPENLLLKATPKGFIIKIVDFGLSNAHEGGKLLSTACGSPCYAAPEMIAGKKYVGPLVDIWSMGVILFTLVCGYLPFEDQNTSHLYKKILAGNYSTPKWLSANVKDLIKRILEIKPTKRISISDIRQHKWFSLVNGADIPHEDTLVATNDELETKTIKDLTRAGYKKDDILEGIASHSYNPTTASYFLMKQKNYVTMQSVMATATISNETSAASFVDSAVTIMPSSSETVKDVKNDVNAVPTGNVIVESVITDVAGVISEISTVIISNSNSGNNDQKVGIVLESPDKGNTQQPQDQQLRQLQKFREKQQKRIQDKLKLTADKANNNNNNNLRNSTNIAATNTTCTAESAVQQLISEPIQYSLVGVVGSTRPAIAKAAVTSSNINISTSHPLSYLNVSDTIESQPVLSPVRVDSIANSIPIKNMIPVNIQVENEKILKDDEIRTSSIAEPMIDTQNLSRPTKETIPASFPRLNTRKDIVESATTATATALKPLDAFVTGIKVPSLRSSPRVPFHIITSDVSISNQPTSSRTKNILDPLTDMFKSVTPYPSMPSSTLQSSPRMMNLTLKMQQPQSLPIDVQSAPDVATRSSVKTGGRKGRHLKAIVPSKDSSSNQNSFSVANPLDTNIVNSKLAQVFDGISIN